MCSLRLLVHILLLLVLLRWVLLLHLLLRWVLLLLCLLVLPLRLLLPLLLRLLLPLLILLRGTGPTSIQCGTRNMQVTCRGSGTSSGSCPRPRPRPLSLRITLLPVVLVPRRMLSGPPPLPALTHAHLVPGLRLPALALPLTLITRLGLALGMRLAHSVPARARTFDLSSTLGRCLGLATGLGLCLGLGLTLLLHQRAHPS